MGWLRVAPAGPRATKASGIHDLEEGSTEPSITTAGIFLLLVQVQTLRPWASMKLRVSDIEGESTDSSSAALSGQKMVNMKQQEVDSVSDLCTCVNNKFVFTETRVEQKICI